MYINYLTRYLSTIHEHTHIHAYICVPRGENNDWGVRRAGEVPKLDESLHEKAYANGVKEAEKMGVFCMFFSLFEMNSTPHRMQAN